MFTASSITMRAMNSVASTVMIMYSLMLRFAVLLSQAPAASWVDYKFLTLFVVLSVALHSSMLIRTPLHQPPGLHGMLM